MHFFRKKVFTYFIVIICVLLLITNAVIGIDARTHVPEGLNVLLISIDTLRYDALGYNNHDAKGITPYIDQFSQRAINYTNCLAPSSWTLPSHMSMMTGLYPESHKLYTDEAMYMESTYDPALVMMAEGFRNNNYYTAAITGGAFVHSKYGFQQGFNFYHNGNKDDSIAINYKYLKNFLENHRDDKFFMFFHTYEVHAPYTHTQYLGDLQQKGMIDARQVREIEEYLADPNSILSDMENKLKTIGAYNRDVTHNLYLAGVNYMDGYFGKIIDTLEELELMDKTMIIFTSDHGEEFGEHNPDMFYDKHYQGLFSEHIHIPLLIYIPGEYYQGKTVETPVSLVDLLPTVYEYMNIPRVEKVQGINILDHVDRKRGERIQRSLYASTHLTDASLKSVVHGSKKYIRNYGDRFKPQEEGLYDLTIDPREQNNLADTECISCNEFRKLIDDQVKFSEGFLNIKIVEENKFDENLFIHLKSLGYLN